MICTKGKGGDCEMRKRGSQRGNEWEMSGSTKKEDHPSIFFYPYFLSRMLGSWYPCPRKIIEMKVLNK